MTAHKGPAWVSAVGGRGSSALRLSVALGVIEVVVWSALGLVKALYGPPSTPGMSLAGALLLYAADHFGDITIALATTAYVVFTYHMLESAAAQRRLSAEPFLTLRWQAAAQAAEYRIDSFEAWATRACDWLQESGIIKLDLAALPPAENRHLNIEIENARDVPITWLEIQVTASAVFPRGSWTTSGQLKLPQVNLTRGGRLGIAVADLGPILSSAAVSIRIDTLIYGPADSSVLVKNYAGDATFSSSGCLVLQTQPATPEMTP
jgi:hypothetical protein